jgi:hypothetical protein
MSPGRKAAIGHQRNGGAEAHAGERPGNCRHLLHTGAALGTLIADHDGIPGDHLAAQDGSLRLLLALKDAQGPRIVFRQ